MWYISLDHLTPSQSIVYVCVVGGFQIENFTNLRAFCGLEHHQGYGFYLDVVMKGKLLAGPSAQFGKQYSSGDHW